MARPAPLRLLSLLLWFVLCVVGTTASTSKVSSHRKKAVSGVCYGNFTPARTPLKIPTGSAAGSQVPARRRVFSRDTLHALAHTIQEHPAQTAILSLMV